ncbi:SHOCT domain-containing protein [Paenarthrobacter sp. A20]|uniref:SHOCT domain-containing protein n=1 Tax=Paenarthrobacter sp. A20 TaxID=2817891 RepID=UPI00209E379E|nr:SHOCT domain-containing protein [Paenarthrobacter sp. A20]MCP1411377.1 ABC-type multidrug transport system fused ATPase/permease subunit [Paenarthrobacter sp. A20]
MNFLESLWSIIVAFFFIAYLILLFQIISDLLRDKALNGGVKVLWILCLFIAPFISALIYVIMRGKGMALRSEMRVRESVEEAENYIRDVAGAPSATQQIEAAKALLAAGDITEAEYARLKEIALS